MGRTVEPRARRTLVIAHRTAPLDAPENSLEGIVVASELGADFVEVDVRATRDGVPVLLHDRLLARTTNRAWPVRWVSSRSMTRTRLKGSDEVVPLLSSALEVLPSDLGIAIEVRSGSIARAVLHEVRQFDVAERTLLWTRSARTVRYLAHAAPDIEVALLRGAHDRAARRRHLDDAAGLGARAVSISHDEVDAAFVDEAHDRGLRVYSFLRDRPADLPHQLHLLDGIVTDHVAEAVKLLTEEDDAHG